MKKINYYKLIEKNSNVKYTHAVIKKNTALSISFQHGVHIFKKENISNKTNKYDGLYDLPYRYSTAIEFFYNCQNKYIYKLNKIKLNEMFKSEVEFVLNEGIDNIEFENSFDNIKNWDLKMSISTGFKEEDWFPNSISGGVMFGVYGSIPALLATNLETTLIKEMPKEKLPKSKCQFVIPYPFFFRSGVIHWKRFDKNRVLLKNNKQEYCFARIIENNWLDYFFKTRNKKPVAKENILHYEIKELLNVITKYNPKRRYVYVERTGKDTFSIEQTNIELPAKILNFICQNGKRIRLHIQSLQCINCYFDAVLKNELEAKLYCIEALKAIRMNANNLHIISDIGG